MTMLLAGAGAPDILEVIADLSNDEVFTPPRVANAVLDLLPEHVWSDPDLRWLDPGCKTGVFLREAAKRLMVSLAEAFPDEQERLEHILVNMLYGVAITDLTALMSRRTVYCSKDAAGQHATVPMRTSAGNIWMDRVEHAYVKGRCSECGASEETMERENRENYAYAFIHADGRTALEEEIDMRFDVIVGNPPYQMDGGGGGTNATPLYNVFVDQAKALNPRYMSMIIPSRWMAGGRGLEDFRKVMLADKRIRNIVDYPNAGELFPGVDIKGGVCYLLWNRDEPGECSVTLIRGDDRHGPVQRNLGEFEIFVRDSRALDILHKVQKAKEATLSSLVSGDTPFGLASNFTRFRKSGARQAGEVKVYANSGGKRIEGWIPEDTITKNTALINAWKVLVPKAGSDGGQKLPDVVLGRPIVAGKPSVCTQTYLTVGPVKTKAEAESLSSYIQTRFARFLISIRKISQDAMKSTYDWVPQQTWDRTWTDADLYKKYGITKAEQAYIAEMVKEMPA